ncbi:MAG: hypothetical protein J6B53_09340 [Clostridia bacterium]|jgi:hypothetical protein|nr:hypothetical protein [Clostridia bacterium]
METKTLQQVFDEALKDKAMKSKLLKAIKEKKLPDFMKAHGCNATMEEAIEFGKAKLAAGEIPLSMEEITELLWAY